MWKECGEDVYISSSVETLIPSSLSILQNTPSQDISFPVKEPS